MRLGLVARADNTGLGSQTYELYKWLNPAKTLVIDISAYNRQHNQFGYENYFERYNKGEVLFSVNFPDNAQIDQFLEGLDVVLTVESPYSYYLYSRARELGVKTVQQYNYEFIDFFVHADWPKPDLMLAPSPWNYEKIKAEGDYDKATTVWGTQLRYIPVPVNRTLFPFKQKTEAKTFLHIAGHSTYVDRNGTKTVLDAIPLVKSGVKFLIRSQYQIPQLSHDWRVTVEIKDVPNYWELYNNEEVLLLPRKYGGLSLQLAEAMSCGMIPLMLDVPPQNSFLTPPMLVPAEHVETVAPRTPIEVYNCTPQQLADRIDELANAPTENITALSDYCNDYSQSISWETLLPRYIEVLEECWKS